MITQPEVEKITEDCINETVQNDEEYGAEKPLGLFGVLDEDLISTFIQHVSKNKEIGVPSIRKHKIKADVFEDIGPDTLCGEVEDLIMDNAVEPKPKKAAEAKKVTGVQKVQKVEKVQKVQHVQEVQKAAEAIKTATASGRKRK
ncbi:MAG: hypothetical protein ABL984_15460 [Pyrinomonadaceae bacterium]